MPAFERRLNALSGICKSKARDKSFASRSVVAKRAILSCLFVDNVSSTILRSLFSHFFFLPLLILLHTYILVSEEVPDAGTQCGGMTIK